MSRAWAVTSVNLINLLMKLSILRLFHYGKIFFIDGKKIPAALAGDSAAGILLVVPVSDIQVTLSPDI